MKTVFFSKFSLFYVFKSIQNSSIRIPVTVLPFFFKKIKNQKGSCKNRIFIMAKSLVNFFTNNIGWTFNFLAAQILWWVVAFPVAIKYGYSNNNYDSKGGIPSGGEGSGIFIICLVIVVLVTLVYVKQVCSYFSKCE